jgi:hypothetical protein
MLQKERFSPVGEHRSIISKKTRKEQFVGALIFGLLVFAERPGE